MNDTDMEKFLDIVTFILARDQRFGIHPDDVLLDDDIASPVPTVIDGRFGVRVDPTTLALAADDVDLAANRVQHHVAHVVVEITDSTVRGGLDRIHGEARKFVDNARDTRAARLSAIAEAHGLTASIVKRSRSKYEYQHYGLLECTYSAGVDLDVAPDELVTAFVRATGHRGRLSITWGEFDGKFEASDELAAALESHCDSLKQRAWTDDDADRLTRALEAGDIGEAQEAIDLLHLAAPGTISPAKERQLFEALQPRSLKIPAILTPDVDRLENLKHCLRPTAG